MMFRLSVKVTLTVLSICMGSVFLHTFIFNASNPTAVLLSAQEPCDYACLFQIEPGHTRVGQARAYLDDHEWITDIQEVAPGNGYAQVSWGWSGAQPEVIDTSQRGKLTFVWDDDDPQKTKINDAIVETISIYTHAGIYPFQKVLGPTRNGSASDQLEGNLRYAVYYNRAGSSIAVHIELPCPANLTAYWAASTRLTISIGQTKSQYVPPVEMLNMC